MQLYNDLSWETGYANMIQHFAAYKKHTSITETGTISEAKNGKKMSSKQMVPKNKQELPS